ncbi:cytochrome C oxidase subunit IV family protein [Pseudomonas sp. GD03721]|uniref:cytochrome C oxidase subunit IV family protein n=1 Tax=Pseudomonas TaxID=286 RepID=UPI000938B00F|nr:MULTISPECIES: cytochrome C oxidase subunit IV family protein [Pseudomonas]MDH0639322.1 cytochrome C oxidase subunit IV family protein [Pseudomonas sp. GD03860]MDH1440426.1 cytochrome C oxidase subunit IV family protein [Pseudomonas sp. GD03722]WGG03486.1 cytochrome C oxidase subunit IV family protein [Pseudomonas sp. GD03721]WGG07654.1 cytochrome C oxidase subunit IV family protein [Pseudomonas sp. GD03919]
MKKLFWTRNTAIWLLLVAVTLVAWQMGHGVGGLEPAVAGVAILVISLVKVRFVLFDFMELSGAPAGMRWVGDLWLVGLGLILSARFLLV